MRVYKQSGRNSNYPDEIETWRFGEKIPDWISDIAKIKFIDAEGNMTLETRETNTGGIEIIGSDGTRVILRLSNKSNIVCYCSETKKLFALTPLQLSLLYKEVLQK